MRPSLLLTSLVIPVCASEPVSYSRQIAPLLALNCNSCHGDQGTAGNFRTRAYADLVKGGDLGKAIIPGDPDQSPLVQFIEGRRGEEHRMPLGAPPLAPQQIELIRRWIADGAVPDRDTTAKYLMALPKLRAVKSSPFQVSCRVPILSYLILNVWDLSKSRTLRTEAARSKPGEWVSWTFWPEKNWPKSLLMELTITYAESEPVGAVLRVTHGKTHYRTKDHKRLTH